MNPARKQIKAKRVIVFFILSVSVVLGFFASLIINTQFNSSPWNLQEWLINYQGGFVRRGLVGELLYKLYGFTGVSPVSIALVLSAFGFLSLSWISLKVFSNKLDPLFILSPIILGGPIGPIIDGYLVRKDAFCVVLMLIALAIICRNKSLGLAGKYLIVNLLSCFAILTHEAFAFYGLSSIFLAYFIRFFASQSGFLLSLSRSFLNIIPSLALFAVVAFNAGDRNTALAIHESWISIPKAFPWDNTSLASQPTGAIDAIGWTKSEAISLSVSLLSQFSGPVWIPFAWIFTIFVISIIAVNSLISSQGKSREELRVNGKNLLFTLFAQLISVSPLFLLGWDFGRWIFFWAVSSVAVFSFNKQEDMAFLVEKLNFLDPLFSRIPRLSENQILLSYLLIGIPPSRWSIDYYIGCTPIVSLVKSCIAIIKGVSGVV